MRLHYRIGNRKLDTHNLDIFERFTDIDENGCWSWKGYKRKDGYSNFFINGKACLVHRISYILFNGNIPKGKCVLHKCDNRNCVNPFHFWLGSYSDNARDMISKGRQNWPLGQRQWQAKLTEKDVKELRRHKPPTNKTQIELLAKEYGVSKSTISHVIHRHHWKWLN